MVIKECPRCEEKLLDMLREIRPNVSDCGMTECIAAPARMTRTACRTQPANHRGTEKSQADTPASSPA